MNQNDPALPHGPPTRRELTPLTIASDTAVDAAAPPPDDTLEPPSATAKPLEGKAL